MNMKSMMKDGRKYLAEMAGTLLFTLVGFGALVIAATGQLTGFTTTLLFPLAFGLAVAAVIYIFGSISGAHINPAVSLGFALRKKLSWKDCAFYMIAQVLGAIAGVAILFGLYKLMTGGAAFRFGNTYSHIGPRTVNGLLSVLIIEIVMTYVFVLAWMGIVRKVDNKTIAGLVIGLLFAALMLTGATLNPALNLGNAIFSCFRNAAAIKEVWVYLVGPLVGGALGALMACCLFKGEDRDEVGTKAAPKIADVSPAAGKVRR